MVSLVELWKTRTFMRIDLNLPGQKNKATTSSYYGGFLKIRK